ncbi:adenosylcobinamide amidohydrolase [Paenibacillus rhizovicinus]|uniref:Adenosylcobinamide amidohydrolase n=1 Tax=Paenibacillus rhizovicinus TaxID=2704463 RepID=A0A6C0NVM8_9BACL|nr:adenosylcobinamide amidohydrolase [Paenibacillus rhizovicinus]QHW29976.1 adenosylcobinamide amidohydrolase [Paenibacillus rhizovicinus]
MSQPFRHGAQTTYESSICSGISIRYAEDRLMIQTDKAFMTLSSALHGGGFGSADRFINREVPLDYDCADPAHEFGLKLIEWGCPPHATLGFLTAAKLTHASVIEANGDAFALLCCVTAGTGNAARAGLARPTYPAYAPGTVNMFLFIDGNLTAAAMVNAVITATEAKTTALQDCGIIDRLHGLPATGTTTDAIVVAASQTDKYGVSLPYAGAATTLGNALGCLVYDAVTEAVSTQGEA